MRGAFYNTIRTLALKALRQNVNSKLAAEPKWSVTTPTMLQRRVATIRREMA